MNKKGKSIFWWAAFFSIITGILIVYDHREQISVWLGKLFNPELVTPKTPAPQLPLTPQKPPFDFSKISVDYISPIRSIMYSDSNNFVCYSFNNPNDKINSTFILIGEWFFDNETLPYAPCRYNETLNYNEVFDSQRLNWCPVENYSNVKFRVALAFSKGYIDGEITYNLTTNTELIDYLKKEDENITWDNEIIKEFANNTPLCNLSDKKQAEEILTFVREEMNPPPNTEAKVYLNQHQMNFENSWKSKVGTSSEYSYVYASFLRAIGIPAKIETNRFGDYDYYYVKVYIKDKGWLPVDVFNESKKIGDCFILGGNLKKDREYKDICIPALLEYVVFDRIIAHMAWHGGGSKIDYTIRNTYGKSMKSYCIEINHSYYDEDQNYLSSDRAYLLHTDFNETSIDSDYLYLSDISDFDSAKIELKEFSSLCS